uniref:Putative N-acetylmuramoyl-L-alanine amidase n=1 Tax=viral metagenome TaxID=1070528 RepID=A0A6M3LXE8_9ZZZZ
MHGGITYKERDLNVTLVKEIMKATPTNSFFWKPDVDCEELPSPTHLRKRVENINRQSDVAGVVSIHHNSCGNTKRTGGEIIYWDTSQAGYLLARYITQEMALIPMKVNIVPALKQLGRKLYLLRKTKAPAVIVEPGFMSNHEDLHFVIDHHVFIADAIREGVSRWVRELYGDE